MNAIEKRTVIFALEMLLANQDDEIYNERIDFGDVLCGESLERFVDELRSSDCNVSL